MSQVILCKNCDRIFNVNINKTLRRGDKFPCTFCKKTGIYIPHLEISTTDGVLEKGNKEV